MQEYLHSLCNIAKISKTEGEMQNKEIVALKFRYFSNLFEGPRGVMFTYTNVSGINLAFIYYSTCLRLAFSSFDIIYMIAGENFYVTHMRTCISQSARKPVPPKF